MDDQEGGDLVSQLVDSVREISGLPECRNAVRKMYGNLMRRVKLLSPLFEELKDNEQQLDDGDLKGLQALRVALNLALEVLKSVNDGSKIYQVKLLIICLERENGNGQGVSLSRTCEKKWNWWRWLRERGFMAVRVVEQRTQSCTSSFHFYSIWFLGFA
ncbi:hypothetical protein Hanom_Chr06g00562081 [Helianthus anomalus]